MEYKKFQEEYTTYYQISDGKTTIKTDEHHNIRLDYTYMDVENPHELEAVLSFLIKAAVLKNT